MCLVHLTGASADQCHTVIVQETGVDVTICIVTAG